MGHFIGDNTTAVLQLRAFLYSQEPVVPHCCPREKWALDEGGLNLAKSVQKKRSRILTWLALSCCSRVGIYERETEVLHTSVCPAVCLEVL